jgi:diguanylate cyclase (GGDEF)-like protein
MVAQRIQTCTDEGEFAARLGGDEFVIVGRTNREWTEIQAKAEEIITVLTEMYCLSEHNVNTSTSVGIALYPENGADYSDLLKNADRALYEAKDAGRGTWRRLQNELQVL